MRVESLDMRITSIRSRGARGGAIASAEESKDGGRFVLKFDYKFLADSNDLQKGQVWNISGPVSLKHLVLPHGRIDLEKTVDIESATLLMLSGENIVRFLVDNPSVKGVGEVKARKLYHRFGTSLFNIINDQDVEKLNQIVSEKATQSIFDAFKKMGTLTILLRLDQAGIPRPIGRKVMAFYGQDAERKVLEDPYRLLSFGAKWASVDKFAINVCGFIENSEVRLQAAIEEALYRCFDNGSTAATAEQLKARLRNFLEDASLIKLALENAISNGQYYCSEKLYHPAGAWLMECFIVDRLALYRNYEQIQSPQFALDVDRPVTLSIIAAFEQQEGYNLTPEQKVAVETSTSNAFSLIIGGAGVGKTTVLKCIYAVIEAKEPFTHIYQLALSGKAAKRMTEATGRESYTIAGFLHNVVPEDIPANAWVVVDESSMVDLITFYRLLRHMPKTCKMILIGDQFQLPPVGPGLILHALVNSNVPQSELTQVKRQSEASGIPSVASDIRSGLWPNFLRSINERVTGVSFVSSKEYEINNTVVDVYQKIGGTGLDNAVQVLCPTKTGVGGTEALNIALQNYFKADQEFITYQDDEFGEVEYKNGMNNFRLNDLVIYTKNDYLRGLRNGSLGKIVDSKKVQYSNSDVACVVDFEGVLIECTIEDLECMELAYAITVHRSQGSQFERVVIPIRKSRLLDLSLLYTAITRGVKQVVLVGDQNAAKVALNKLNADTRTVGLKHLISNSL